MYSSSTKNFLLQSLFLAVFILIPISVNAANKIALLIGNSNYSDGKLLNPVNDASAMAETLKSVGFDVVIKKDASQQEMENAINQFGKKLEKGGVGLFFYAGHGVQSNGINYLIPIGADLQREKDLRYKAVNLGQILDEMGSADNGLNIVILDACRNNPLTRSFRSSNKGLAKMDNVPTGTLLAYSTAPGSVASDGEGKNSPYTTELLKAINNEQGLPLEMVFKEVTKGVQKKTAKMQVPWISSSVTGDFYFKPKLKSIHSDSNVLTQNRTVSLQNYKLLENQFAKISAGCFNMGSPAHESGRQNDEKQHSVCIKKDFYIAKTEVTQKQWQVVMKNNPSFFNQCGDNCPVEQVSLQDINQYIHKLGQATNLSFRLPTEAEWEYACRGKTSNQLYCGGNIINELAWYSLNSDAKTHAVGQLNKNSLGLSDMSGNVWEWTCSAYSNNYNGSENICSSNEKAYALRGGSWYKFPAWQRAANRKLARPSDKNRMTGFRLVVENPSIP